MGLALYLAAPWIDRDKMPAIAQRFEAAGHKITHKWWLVDNLTESERSVEVLKSQAQADFKGVIAADKVVVFNTSKSEGKAVEQGIAIAMKIPIIVVGKRGDGTSKNIFHYLDCYNFTDDIEEALCQLT